jgi:hypothetical protein
MYYGTSNPENLDNATGRVLENMSASKQLDLLKTLSDLESELKVGSDYGNNDGVNDCHATLCSKIPTLPSVEPPAKIVSEILIMIGKNLEMCDDFKDYSAVRRTITEINLYLLPEQKSRWDSSLSIDYMSNDP